MPDTLLGIMSASSAPIRVLVVDDDAMSRELISLLLKDEGYAVESAESGIAALVMLRGPAPTPDLILADVQMPGITGVQLARKLRRACGPATLLLAISGSQPPPQTISLFDGFLMKPFKMEEVSSALIVQTNRSTPPTPLKKRRLAGGSVLGQSNLLTIPASAQEQASKTDMCTQVQAQSNHHVEDVVSNAISSIPVLNEIIYLQLAVTLPAEQLQEMYAMCVNDARKRIDHMRALAAARDSAQFVREAHSIKGGCGMLGATELHRMATELEANGPESGSRGQTRTINSLDELSHACDRLERMLRERVRG